MHSNVELLLIIGTDTRVGIGGHIELLVCIVMLNFLLIIGIMCAFFVMLWLLSVVVVEVSWLTS